MTKISPIITYSESTKFFNIRIQYLRNNLFAFKYSDNNSSLKSHLTVFHNKVLSPNYSN